MHYSTRASLVVVAIATSFLSASCSDTDARNLGPSGITTSSAFAVDATSPTVAAQRVGDPSCPSIPPFNVAFGVNVRSRRSDMNVTAIRFRFTDTAGLQSPLITLPAPAVTLPAPGPTQTFGDPQVRTFPLVLGIGCGTGTRGTILVVVETADGVGNVASQTVRVEVR